MGEPAQLAKRPHHGRYPIPWITYLAEDGTPDFRVHVESKRRRVAEERLCQLCGLRMGEEVTFIGFETALAGMRFGEPPAHRECLDYALEVCPWLGGSDYSGREHDPETSVAPRPPQPTRMVIYTCNDFEAISDPSGETELIYVAGWATKRVEYFQRSVPVSS